MVILALDLSRHTGWAAGAAGARPANGVWHLPPGEQEGVQAAAYADVLAAAIAVHSPDLVIAEVNVHLHKQNPAATAYQQIGMAYLTALVCYRRTVRYRQATAEEARIKMLGRARFGGSAEAKAAVLTWANTENKYGVTDHNIADALLLWHYAHAMSKHIWRVAA
jgi:hypothetical protein